MSTQTSGHRAHKLAILASACFVAFAANAFFIPKPQCSQNVSSYKWFIRMTWSPVTDSTGYLIYRSGNTDFGSAVKVNEINDSTTTTWDDYSIKPGTKYYYWILPKDNNGAYLDETRYGMGYSAKPSLPAPTVSAGTYAGYIKVTWKPITAAQAYVIFYSSSTTRYSDIFWDSNFYWSNDGKSIYTLGNMPVAKKYYFWLGAYFNGYLFVSKVSKAGWRKKVLTIYTPKLLEIPSNEPTGQSWWACTLSGDDIVPSKASLTCSVKNCASFTKFGSLDELNFCGDITGKKNGKAYITIQHSKLKVKSKAITIIKSGYASASAS